MSTLSTVNSCCTNISTSLAICPSMVSTSREKRLMTRPRGFVSKKFIGWRMMLDNMVACSFFEATTMRRLTLATKSKVVTPEMSERRLCNYGRFDSSLSFRCHQHRRCRRHHQNHDRHKYRDADLPLFLARSEKHLYVNILYFLLFHLSLSELSVSFCVHFL